MNTETPKDIVIRENLTFVNDLYKHERLREISQETEIDRRYSKSIVESRKGGTLTYKGRDKSYDVSFVVQFAESADGEPQALISMETDFEGFTHLAISGDNKDKSYDLLESNLKGTQEIMQSLGIEFGESSLASDIINLFKTLEEVKLLS
jgi:hypothetical protein